MRLLLHELGRFARSLPLEARTRWHASRAIRHHDLSTQHRRALTDCQTEVRALLASR